MIPELGSFAIILALCFALLQSTSGIFARVSAYGQFLFLSFAMLCLIACFLGNDMSVIFVREHSHQLLPFIYRLGAAWGGHEGSVLLWCLILSGWTLAFVIFSSITDKTIIMRVLGLVNSGFLVFLIMTSNPFTRDFPTTIVTGNDLTPVLQDPGLIFHPPMLYSGYVGFAIGFAIAISALIRGSLTKEWLRACRPWILLPWSFLGTGIVLGSWWAYRELGWGGWWFWDPVENASLLPWLCATALLHSLIVSEKREVFKGWTILLAIVTFSLSLLGTFLVRSGVLVSVHTFANDPARGVFLLSYLACIVGSALFLYCIRIRKFYAPHTFQLFSRETLLLINSVILITAMASIVLGTLYPIILESLHLEKISVGEPYFNTVFVPLMIPLLLLMGLAPHVHWSNQLFGQIYQKLGLTFIVCLIISAIIPMLLGFPFYWLTTLGIFLGIWIIVATLQYAYQLRRSQNAIGLQHWAMIVAHTGIAIVVLGITVSKSYSQERQVKMQTGEAVQLAGYQFQFQTINESNGPNYQNIIAHFTVQHNNVAKAELYPELRIYSHDQLLSKTAIAVNPWRDLYLALGTSLADGSWSVRIYYKPFVRWIWFGGFMLLIGGLLSLANLMRGTKSA